MSNYASKFLGSVGLTSAEANYTANIVKELAQKIGLEINQMSLFKKTLLANGKETPFNKQLVVEELEKKCLQEGNLFALSAWLREGIKAKNDLIQNVQYDRFEKELPVEPSHPKLKNAPSAEDIKWGLPVNELAEFLSFEAKAAHIGKKVHPSGVFESWFKQIRDMEPVTIHPSNKDYIVKTEVSIDEVALSETFFKLQQEYREAETKVNYYKAKIENLLNAEVQKVNAENRALLAEHKAKQDAYESECAIIESEIESARSQKLNEISQLKVIIPNALDETLKYVQTFSKKKKN